jgi:hypothetical protein
MEAKAERGQGLSKLDRDIVTALLETKAVNFEALGKAIATVGPASVLMEDDGWIRWCGSDLRIYRWPRPRLGLEELVVLRDIIREMGQTHIGGAAGGAPLHK